MTELGHNNPPPDPFGPHEVHILDLVELAEGCLTGDPIDTAEKAAQVDELLDSIKKAATALESTRKAAKAPWDAGAKAVQEAVKPLETKLVLAKDTAQKALTPWRLKVQAERDAEQQRLREEAARLQAEAQAKIQATAPTDLAARIEAEEALKTASKATATANRIGRSATGLRTRQVATVTNPGAFLAWLKENRADELKAWLADQAQRECNAGHRQMAGVLVEAERKAA